MALSVYIWNLRETEAVVGQLKALRPDVVVMVGGPELSFGSEHSSLDLWLIVLSVVKAMWCLLSCVSRCWLVRTIPLGCAVKPPVKEIAMPYAEYTDEDLGTSHYLC